MRRVVFGLVTCLLAALLAPSGHAAAGDHVVARDTAIRQIFALRGTLVYQRAGSHGPLASRPWMRVLDGHRRPAQGVPDGAYASAIGRDGAGRIIVTMAVQRYRRHALRSIDWWLYDVRRDRARRLHQVAGGPCSPNGVAIWWHQIAYSVSCARRAASGVFLGTGGGVRRVNPRFAAGPSTLVLRGGTLLAALNEGDANWSIWRLAADGRSCRLSVPGSFVDEEWQSRGVWLYRGSALWWPAYAFDTAPGVLIGARLNGCGEPGAIGVVAGADLPDLGRGVAVDGRGLLYADAGAIRRRALPSAPDTEPPSNDAFANATPLQGDLPLSSPPDSLGNATVELGEAPHAMPSSESTWFSFSPASSQPVSASVHADWNQALLDVFEGPTLASLTRVAGPAGDSGRLEWNATAGHTYWIRVACSGRVSVCFLPYQLKIDPAGALAERSGNARAAGTLAFSACVRRRGVTARRGSACITGHPQ